MKSIRLAFMVLTFGLVSTSAFSAAEQKICSFRRDANADVIAKQKFNEGEEGQCKIFCLERAGAAGITDFKTLSKAKCRLGQTALNMMGSQQEFGASGGADITRNGVKIDPNAKGLAAVGVSAYTGKQKKAETLSDRLQRQRKKRETQLNTIERRNDVRLAHALDRSVPKVENRLARSERLEANLKQQKNDIALRRQQESIANAKQVEALKKDRKTSSAAEIKKIDRQIASITAREAQQDAQFDSRVQDLERRLERNEVETKASVERLEKRQIALDAARAEIKQLNQESNNYNAKTQAEMNARNQRIASLLAKREKASLSEKPKIDAEIAQVTQKINEQLAIDAKKNIEMRAKLAAAQAKAEKAINPKNLTDAERIAEVKALNEKHLQNAKKKHQASILRTKEQLEVLAKD